MNIIVVGGGKVGYYLTKTLLEHGHFATLIEEKKRHCEKLANLLDTDVIFGDGTLPSVLESAGAKQCDAIIGVTGKDENNLICCQIAKNKFHISKTIARVNNPKNADLLKLLGVDITLSTTALLAHMIEREADNASVKEVINFDSGEASLTEVCITRKFKYLNMKLKDIPLPDQMIIAVIHRQEELIIPNGDTKIMEGDVIFIIAHQKVVHLINKMVL